jgi:tellurite methyltransferase
MKRHPGLAPLSRDHHHALVLARKLKDNTVGSDALRQIWIDKLNPHFVIEDRELIPIGCCGSTELRRLTEAVATDHVVLRNLFMSLDSQTSEHGRAAIAQRLEDHVHLEERDWFPAIESELDDAALLVLERRLQETPEAAIVGYHLDDEAIWVADLDCGHRQHIRHKPPFQNAAWVTTEDGRAQKLGSFLPCRLCRMPRLPACAAVYKETAIFDAASVPAGLLASHRLKPGTWGQIEVLSGRLEYVLEDESNLSFVLRSSVLGTVAPSRPHHVSVDSDTRFRVRFYTCGAANVSVTPQID